MRNILDSTRGRNSVYPPTEGLTFHPFIYMVPQFKPEDVLMLGFAGGTTAGLIRMLYGGIPIIAVDIDIQDDYDERYNVKLIKEDARKYIKRCSHFQVIIVDLYDDGTQVPCDFVTDTDFITDLKDKAGYIIVHAKDSTDMSGYGKPLKVLELNDSRFYYYMVYEIPTLPIR